MFKKFSVLLAALFALSVGMLQAQTFTHIAGQTSWNAAGTWTPAGGASGFPGQAVNNGDVTIANSVTFTNTPANPISSLTLSGSAVVGFTAGAGTLTITGNLTIPSGTTLAIPANMLIIVNGTTTLNSASGITFAAGTSQIQFNGPLTGGGTIANPPTAAALGSYNVQFGSGVTSISGANFLSPFAGVINTGGPVALTSSLSMGAAGVLNLSGTMTLNSGVTLSITNPQNPPAVTAGPGINRDGTAGQLQGASATSIVDFSGISAAGYAINGSWFANPFNGRLQTANVATAVFNNTMTLGSTGVLDLRNNLQVQASSNLILNNTAANSLTGTGQLSFVNNTSTITLGPSFNGGTVDFDRFASPMLGTLNTGGNLTATGTATPIITIGNAASGILSLTGTLTVASGKTITIAGTAAGTLAGSGVLSAAAANSTVSFNPNTANGGFVPGQNFSNPWNGTIQTAGAMGLSSSLTVGPSGILNLGGTFTIALGQTLTLNCTNPVGTALPGAGLIVGAAGTTSVLEIGNNTFSGFLPVTKIGTGTGWAPNTGILRLLGSSTLSDQAVGAYTFTMAGILEIAPSGILTVASGKTLDLTGTLQRQSNPAPTASTAMGRINGQDNTSVVNLATTFNNNTNTGTGTNVPGTVFGTPTFDGRLQMQQSRTLAGNLRMGSNSILDMTGGANQLTVNNNAGPPVRNDTLFLNQVAAGGLLNTAGGSFQGTGTVFIGNNALGGTYPTLALNAFAGRTIVGDGINFTSNTALPTGMILQLNGATTIAAGITVTAQNTAASSITGTGTIQGATGTSNLTFAAGANGGVVPGANIFGTPDALTSQYNGTLQTAGAMNLTGNLNMGPNAILNLGGNLTLANNPPSRVLLQMTGTETTVMPGAGKLAGQPQTGSTTNIPEIILATNAFVSVLPSANRITFNNGAADFGGRFTIGSGFTVTPGAPSNYSATLSGTTVNNTNSLTFNSPATLNIVNGATLTVAAGAGININSSTVPTLGPQTGVIQGANNTAIVQFGSNSVGPIQGQNFANPFNGSMVIDASQTLAQTLRMSATSLLTLNNTLNVNAGAILQLDGGVNSVQGMGVLTGSNSTSRIILSNGFNGGVLPASRFASPINASLETGGAMTLSGSALTIGISGALTLGGNLTLPASSTLTLSNTGLNSFVANNNSRVIGQSSSRVILGGNFNSRLLPGAAFTDFAGQIQMNSPLSLTSPLLLGSATGQLDLGTAGNTLTLGVHNLSIVNPIQTTSSTAFVVTNDVGAMIINNPALTSFFYPIGTTSASYTPISLRSTSGTADVFSVRVRPVTALTNTPVPSAPNQFDGFVNREWVVSAVSAAGAAAVRGMSFVPQWNANNETGTFLRFSTGVAAFAQTTTQYLQSTTTGSTTLADGALTTNGNLPPLAYSNTAVVVYSRRPTYVAVNPFAATITSFTPQSVPASNDAFTIQFFGLNLNSVGANAITSITARNLASGGTAVGTVLPSSFGSQLNVSFPGGIRNVVGTITVTITSANTSFTSANITVSTVASPTLTAIAPVTTASGRAFALTLTGTGFFTNATVLINNVPARPLATTSATTSVVEYPAALNATANTVTVRLRNGDGLFAERTYSVGQAGRPVITSVSPIAVFANSPDTEVTINGTGFFGPGNIQAFYGAQLVPVRFVSSTQVVITIPASLLTVVGNPSIILANSDAQNIGYVFTVRERVPLGPTPRIVSATPSVTTASFRAFSVTLNGENFNPSALITVLGQFVNVTSRTGTTAVSFEIPAGLNTTTNSYEVVLQNPDLQFTSATVRIGNALPAPSIAGIFPSATTNSLQPRPFALTIRGNNFSPDAQVFYNGVPLTIVSVSTNTIIANVPSNEAGAISVVVVNGDGQATTVVVYNVINKVTEQTLPNVSLYPSPVVDFMTISAGFTVPTKINVTITNIVGQRVMSFSEQASGAYTRNVNMTGLPTGSYIVEVSDGARRLVQKVVKY